MTPTRTHVTIAVILSLGVMHPVDATLVPVETESVVAPAHPAPSEGVAVSMAPTVTVRSATPAQRARLELALTRFRGAGLALPDLQVVFAETDAPCRGHMGLFESDAAPWRIRICSEVGAVYEHELAHAWIAAGSTDSSRDDFMELRGFTVWSDHTVPWNQRGVEGAAFVIQQGLGGLPLPPVLSDELVSRLDAFRLLTGFPDPRLASMPAG